MIFLYIFVGLATLVIASLVEDMVFKHRVGITRKQAKKLSWPAQKIWEAYLEIPEDYRPNGNLYETLSAMDYKYDGKETVNRRCGHYYKGSRPTWGTFRGREGYRDYFDLFSSFVGISEALEQQKRTVELDRYGDALSMVDSMMKQAHETTEIVNQVTREMT